jgi:tetratricopeptide (TPR) repeat protein
MQSTMQLSKHNNSPLRQLRRRGPVTSLFGLGLAILGACSAQTLESEGDQHMRRARFVDALDAYEAAKASGNSSKDLPEKMQEAYFSAKLQEGCEYLFAGKLLQANNVFRELAARFPENPTITKWLEKSERDLSRYLTVVGKDHLGVRNYEKAIECFKKAIDLDPNNAVASASLERTVTILQWRAEKGELLWREGLRSINESSPLQAQSQIQNSLEYVPDRPEAADLLSDLKQQIGELRQRLGRDLEDKGQFKAAEKQYRLAATYGYAPPDVQSAIQRTGDEGKADELVRTSDLALAKNDYARARTALEKARSYTKNTENLTAIDARLFQVAEKQNAYEYKVAQVSEFEGKLEDAIAKFTALDARAPGYRDCRERIDRLGRQLQDSKEAYEDGLKQLEAGNLENARSKFKAAIFLSAINVSARAKLKEVESMIDAKNRPKPAENKTPESVPEKPKEETPASKPSDGGRG